MNRRRVAAKNLLVSLFTLALIAGLFSIPENGFLAAGVSDMVREIQEFIKGWNTFFSRLSAFTSLLGFKTMMLFLAVLLISSGLAAIGIPRGKISFFSALLLCNLAWIAFKDSFNPETLAYMGPILRANLTLCTPLLLAYGGGYTLKKIRSRLRARKKRDTNPDPEKILAHSLDLYRSLKANDDTITAKSEELRAMLENLK